MGLSREESISKYGTERYTGWNEPEAGYDAKALGYTADGGIESGGGETKSPEQIAQDYANSIVDAQKKTIEEETKFLEQYTADNPFVFDEELARKSATAEYQPYYTELLDDYLQGINLKRESLQADVDLLGKMKSFDLGQRTRAYERAISAAGDGWAGKGMFFSGLRARGLGEKEVEYKAEQGISEERFATQADKQRLQGEVFDVQETQQRRDVGREQQVAIEGGILGREREAITQYQVPLEQSYYRRFPSGTGSPLRGYTVPEYYRT